MTSNNSISFFLTKKNIYSACHNPNGTATKKRHKNKFTPDWKLSPYKPNYDNRPNLVTYNQKTYK